MSSNPRSSTGTMVVLGVLLLLAATASGCGVGLPTQPDVDGGTVQGRTASTSGMSMDSPLELGEDVLSGQGGDEPAVAGEIRVPDAADHNGNAWAKAKGHQSEKWIKRHGS